MLSLIFKFVRDMCATHVPCALPWRRKHADVLVKITHHHHTRAPRSYQLGEHDTWAKMTNFELAVHIPLIIRVPWMTASVGQHTSVLAEMVDVFPTLAALAGLPDPRGVSGSEGINGTSLAQVLQDPTNTSVKVCSCTQCTIHIPLWSLFPFASLQRAKTVTVGLCNQNLFNAAIDCCLSLFVSFFSSQVAAFSQFAKRDIGTDVRPEFWRNETQMMGYSIRVDEWR